MTEKVPDLPPFEKLTDKKLQSWLQEAADYFDLKVAVVYDSNPHPKKNQIEHDIRTSKLVINEASYLEAVLAFLKAAFELMETNPDIRRQIEEAPTLSEYFRHRSREKSEN
jgi:hypothetical protein